MAKFVCDFDQVKSVGEKLSSLASELESNVSTYSSKINSDLESWTGTAKGIFIQQCNSQVQTASSNVQNLAALGEFITSAAQSISDLESELSSLSI